MHRQHKFYFWKGVLTRPLHVDSQLMYIHRCGVYWTTCNHATSETTPDDLRGPAFTSLYSKQGQHRGKHVIIAKLPTVPDSLIHLRRLVSVRVFEVLASKITKTTIHTLTSISSRGVLKL